MTVYFTRLRVGYPDPQQEPPNNPGSWKVFTVCADASKSSCTTRSDIALIKDEADLIHARAVYQNLQKRAAIGKPLKDQYDEKKCHEALSFLHNGHDHKIFRLRQGAIRVYFLYLNEKRIILIKTWAKRKDKLSEGEEEILKNLGESVLSCVSMHDFKQREIT